MQIADLAAELKCDTKGIFNYITGAKDENERKFWEKNFRAKNPPESSVLTVPGCQAVKEAVDNGKITMAVDKAKAPVQQRMDDKKSSSDATPAKKRRAKAETEVVKTAPDSVKKNEERSVSQRKAKPTPVKPKPAGKAGRIRIGDIKDVFVPLPDMEPMMLRRLAAESGLVKKDDLAFMGDIQVSETIAKEFVAISVGNEIVLLSRSLVKAAL